MFAVANGKLRKVASSWDEIALVVAGEAALFPTVYVTDRLLGTERHSDFPGVHS